MRNEMIALALAGLAASGATPSAALAEAGAAHLTAPQTADFKAQADAMLAEAYPSNGPGAAVVVTRGGRVIYASGRGLADLETRRPITPDTTFKLGSIAKQFTAAVVLQLVAERRISLEDPISRFFPDFPQPAARATVRQLLNHTSGVQDYSKIPGWIDKAGARPWTTAELVKAAGDLPAKAAPGTAWEYNNTGYMLLGAIVEKVTGQPWHEALRERVAGPLGLQTLGHPVTGEAGRALARGYTEDNGRPQPARQIHMSVAHAGGGLVGSARDLATWAQALHHGRVVSPILYREMIRPARLAGGSTQPYGFGLRLQRLRGREVLVHGGAGSGLDTDSVYIPSEDVYVAVLANSDEPASDPSTVTRRLAALAIGEAIATFSRAEIPMGQVEPLFGAYRAERGPPLTFFARDGRLYLGRGEREMEAFPAGQDRFFFGSDRLPWIRFVRQADGTPVMEMHEPERTHAERAVRTGPVPPPLTVPAAVLQSYRGTYATEGPLVTVAAGEKGGLEIGPEGQARLPMRPISQTEFMVDAGGYRAVFHPEKGQVDRLTLHRGARELQGKRIKTQPGEAAPSPGPARVPASDPAAALDYSGSYVTDGPVVTITAGADGRLTARVGDSSALPMRQVEPDIFVVEQANARLVFHRENRRVTGVTVHHRGRELRGKRAGA